MDWHALGTDEVIRRLGTDPARGLTPEQAQRRLAQYGPNRLPDPPRRTVAAMVVDQLREPLVALLLAAAVVSGLLGELADAAVVLAIVVLNAALGALQESRAERALEALQGLVRPTARLLRGGRVELLPAAELVPGDVVLLEAGARVPADLRLLEAANLRVDESPLTGESVPVEKEAGRVLDARTPLADRVNCAFMATTVTHGRGTGVVVATGRATEVGRVAALLEEQPDEPSPLQRRLAQVGRVLSAGAVGVVAVVFAVGLARGEPLMEMLLTAVSLAVAAIPEGLPAVVTVVLALGVQRMARRQAIVRRLVAVETLGAATVIASDKTGTITQNRMQMVEAWAGGESVGVGEPAASSAAAGALQWALRGAALVNDARLEPAGPGEPPEAVGDPTETALLLAAAQAGFWPADLAARFPRVAEIPFDSARKRMSTVHRNASGPAASSGPSGRDPAGRGADSPWPPPASLAAAPYLLFTKGSPESVLERSSRWLRGETLEGLGDEPRAAIAEAFTRMARRGLRVLAVAVRPLQEPPEWADPALLEQDLTFLGLLGLMDPPRPEVRSAVEISRRAGVRPVMITGDHPETATAIAVRVGLLPGGDVVTGAELEQMSDEELLRRVERIAVFARVSPEHKLRVVEALRARGHVVAVTGDGVNDAPALRRADIGAAMGLTGTDVARAAADMVLGDDNFATVVAAVAEGRTIFDNIRKFVHYLLSCNVGEVAAIFLAIVAGLGRPLSAVQILWVNLVTDGLPALAMGLEPPEPDLMRRPPRPRGEGVFAGGTGWRVAWQGAMLGVLTLGVYAWSLAQGLEPAQARTAAFASLAFSQLVHALNVRSARRSLAQLGLFSNRALVGALAVSAAAQAIVLWWPPAASLFGVVPIGGEAWAVVAAAALAPLPVVEAAKAVERRLHAA